MLDLLAAAVVFTATVTVLVAVLAALTVVPFAVGVSMAERRGFSTARWGALSVVGVGLGLLLAYLLVRRTGIPWPIAVLPVGLTWAGPGVLWLLEGTEELVGGRAGRHE